MKKIKIRTNDPLYHGLAAIYSMQELFQERGYEITEEQAYILFCEFDYNLKYNWDVNGDTDIFNSIKNNWEIDENIKKIKIKINDDLYHGPEAIYAMQEIFQERGYEITEEQAYILWCEFDYDLKYDQAPEDDDFIFDMVKPIWEVDE